VQNYNRVRTVFPASPLATPGQNKAAALGKVSPPAAMDSEKNLTQFLDFHYGAAESFLGALALPDSAITRYRRVISENDLMQTRQEQVLAALNKNHAALDSLAALEPEPVQTVADTSLAVADSLAVPDTLQLADQTVKAIETPLPDSLAAARRKLKAELNADNTKLEARRKTLEGILTRFRQEVLPFSMFAIGSVLHDYYPDSVQNGELLARMQTEFPEDKFTVALNNLQKGLPVKLVDPREERQKTRLDELFGLISAAPDSAITELQQLTHSEYPSIQLAANYRLGWYYSFEAIDTLLAKPYLDAVLEDSRSGDYGETTRRFYHDKHFYLRDLPLPAVADSSAVQASDSLQTWRFPTPAFIYPTLPDSLKFYRSIPPLMDSLSNELQGSSPPPEPQPEPKLDEPQQVVPPQPEGARKEEAPLE